MMLTKGQILEGVARGAGSVSRAVVTAMITPSQPAPANGDVLFDQLEADIKQKYTGCTTTSVVAGAIMMMGIWGPTLNHRISFIGDMLSYSLGFAGAAVLITNAEALAKRDEEIERLKKAQHDIKVKSLVVEHNAEGFEKDLLTQIAVGQKIAELVPPHMQFAIAQQQGVHWLFAPPPAPPQPEMVIEATQVAAQKTIAQIKDENANNFDLRWLSPGFINAPKIIVGAQGEGKSTLLEYVSAEFLRQNPTAELRIVDIHYDSDECHWLGLDEVTLREAGYLASTARDGYEVFVNAHKELRRRTENNLRYKEGGEVNRIKIVCDEFQGFYDRLSKGEQDNLISIISDINGTEGRKYGITVDLGFHSLKKERNHLDSSVLSNCAWVVCGLKTIADNTNTWPADFQPKVLVQEVKDTNHMIPEGPRGKIARAAVYRKAGPGFDKTPGIVEDPHVVIVPLLEPPPIQVNMQSAIESTGTSDQTDIEQGQKTLADLVYEALPEHARQNPTDEELAIAIYQVTKNEATPKGILYIREMIYGAGNTDANPGIAA